MRLMTGVVGYVETYHALTASPVGAQLQAAQAAGSLYNGMISPFINFTIDGVVWCHRPEMQQT